VLPGTTCVPKRFAGALCLWKTCASSGGRRECSTLQSSWRESPPPVRFHPSNHLWSHPGGPSCSKPYKHSRKIKPGLQSRPGDRPMGVVFSQYLFHWGAEGRGALTPCCYIRVQWRWRACRNSPIRTPAMLISRPPPTDSLLPTGFRTGPRTGGTAPDLARRSSGSTGGLFRAGSAFDIAGPS